MIFPGFLWWVSGFEFQPYVLSVSLEVIAFALTLQAIKETSLVRRVLWTTGATFLGWIYLALVEYAIVMGLIGTVGGVLPVVLANRVATFERYSHYTLPASLAGILFVGGWLFLIPQKTLRLVAISNLVGIAALTHHALAT